VLFGSGRRALGETAVRAIQDARDRDLLRVLLDLGDVLALAGQTAAAADVWRFLHDPRLREPQPRTPGHVACACYGAGITLAPDGNPIRAEELEYWDRAVRLDLTEDLWQKALPDRDWRLLSGVDLFRAARRLARPRGEADLAGEAWDSWEMPEPERELEALAAFERWLPEPGFGWDTVQALVLMADIAARHGRLEDAVRFLERWTSIAVDGQRPVHASEVFGLRALARLVAGGILLERLDLNEAYCLAARDTICAAAEARIRDGRRELPLFDWPDFLTEFSRKTISVRDQIGFELPGDAVRRGWLGNEAASEQQIAAAERRLGCTLPPSHRAFLSASNGFGPVSPFIARLRAVEEIDWFRVEHQEWIDAYNEPWVDEYGERPLDDFPEGRDGGSAPPAASGGSYGPREDPTGFDPRHLCEALQVSDETNGSVILLIPALLHSDGECDAWFFSNVLPGAHRYESFRRLMEEERARLDTQYIG
jgi:hypothetical protein